MPLMKGQLQVFCKMRQKPRTPEREEAPRKAGAPDQQISDQPEPEQQRREPNGFAPLQHSSGLRMLGGKTHVSARAVYLASPSAEPAGAWQAAPPDRGLTAAALHASAARAGVPRAQAVAAALARQAGGGGSLLAGRGS